MVGTRNQHETNFCCCEYENIKGERSHVLATFCDCEAVDSICDNILGCQSIPEEKALALLDTIGDRIRLPYCGGAIRIKMEVVLPVVMLPTFACIGALGPYWTVFSMILFSSCIFVTISKNNICNRVCRFQRRSRFHLTFTISCLLQLFFIFMTIAIGFRKILLWEIMSMITLFLASACFFFLAINDPGYIALGNKDHQDRKKFGATKLEEVQIPWIDSRPIEDGFLQLECSSCGIRRPPRSDHCLICERCVAGRDHHCCWLNICIGQHNHKSFLIFLVLVLLTGSYGVHLASTTICTPEIYLDWFLLPSDCRFVYDEFLMGLCASSICITIMGLTFVSILLLQQFVFISQNITSLEMARARRRGFTRFFCIATKNVNTRGFRKNWMDFLKGRRYQNVCLAL